MTRQQALDFINTLDSKHQSLQPVLRSMARGVLVLNAVLDELAESDSRVGPVVLILEVAQTGAGKEETIKAINRLDSFGAPLQPLLLAMVEGFTE